MNPSHLIASMIIERPRKSTRVVSGPFKRAKATDSATVHDWNKLVGIYEFYLHPYFAAAIAANSMFCIDDGVAQGYYTISMAHRLPLSRHIVYETDELQRKKLQFAIIELDPRLNIDARDECTLNRLKSDLLLSDSGFLLMDCQCGEKDLLTEDLHDCLSRWHILLEVHDYPAPGVGENIMQIFKDSHDISLCWSKDPSPSDLAQIAPYPLNYLCKESFRDMFDEKRGGVMRFLYLVPKVYILYLHSLSDCENCCIGQQAES